MSTVTVEIDDLKALADLICDRDNRNKPPTPENIDNMHGLVMKMAGEHVGEIYSPSDCAVQR
jgi:hypothetical protein